MRIPPAGGDAGRGEAARAAARGAPVMWRYSIPACCAVASLGAAAYSHLAGHPHEVDGFLISALAWVVVVVAQTRADLE